MEMQKQTSATPVVLKETKRKLRVDYEGKISTAEKLKLKLTSSSFWIDRVWYVFRFLIMLGISYVILNPFFSRIAQSFMAREDFMDMTVSLIPKNFTVDIYKALIQEQGYFEAMRNILLLSLCCALIQTFICCMIGYGLSKFKFKGKKVIIFLVILLMIVPPATLKQSLNQHFQHFDLFSVLGWGNRGLFEFVAEIFKKDAMPNGGMQMLDSFWPFIILSLIGCGFKNGLYIFMMLQFFKGVPDELEESAYVDGSGSFRTFIQIILPLSIPMMVTIFLFSFSWQWMDEFYTKLFLPQNGLTINVKTFYNLYMTIPESLKSDKAGAMLYNSAITNTAGMMIMAPLLIVYLFGQKFLVQGIERSGIVG